VPPPPGAVLFARYAYPPNSLGYCGPPDPATLLEAAAGRTDLGELGRVAASFTGAWPFLQLIARCSGIGNPLDARVVEAYWVGNELVDRVTPEVLAAWLHSHFDEEPTRRSASLPSSARAGAVPQHSLQVFAVYPWLDLLRSGTGGPALEVLDRCRIRSGIVVAVGDDLITVRSRALSFDGSRLDLGIEREEHVRQSPDFAGFSVELRPGDTVSLHWDWICDRLSPSASRWLRDCTLRNLASVNPPGAPEPAVPSGA
jgi:hypothetical protein